MEFLNSNINNIEKPFLQSYSSSPEFFKNISDLKTAYTSFQNSNRNNPIVSNYESFKNQQLLNSAQITNHHCHTCHPHHFHVHHIHIPKETLYDALNLKKDDDTNDLLKEVLELKNECRKFREELDKNNNEKNAGNKYIKELENELYLNEQNRKENNFNKYHEMLDKSFEVLNSVSKKCDNEEAKTKGGIYYYQQNDNDYNKLIEAQKNWIDNLPENNNFNNNNIMPSSPLDINDISTGKTYQINDNNNKNSNSRLIFDSKRNNNKGYIIKKGEKINDNNNINNNINEIANFNHNYNTSPEINQFNKNKFNPENSVSNQSNINYNSFPNNENKDNNINNKNENNNINNSNSDNNENENILINNDEEINGDINNNIEKEKNEEEQNPLNQRYLIIDKNGNPILINGEKLLGMDLMTLIGEDGKEVIDKNGNIMLIGPNGEHKNLEDLVPIILDNNKLLLNEENEPILGLSGVPLINIEGSFIAGPEELIEQNYKKYNPIVGLIAKDKNGNPIKININNKDKKDINNNKDKMNIEDLNNNNNDNNDNNDMSKSIDYNKLKPLLDLEGKPIKDSNDNFIILDQDNKPIKNKGISVLLSKDGKPILNSLGNPILINENGEAFNSDINRINIAPVKKKKNKIKNMRKNNKNNKNNYRINYSECNPDSLKKINFIRPGENPFYDDLEYKSSCFACDLGCSVSRSGYSCMNYSPYNNLIRRRSVTPLKYSKDESDKAKRYYRK
jgi:hypothetical protein